MCISRATNARARLNFAQSCRSPTSARYCAASCATKPGSARRERAAALFASLSGVAGAVRRPHPMCCAARGAFALSADDGGVALPDREPALRVVPMPADANQHGDIFGGWVMSQVDIAGSIPASRRARGRVATVAVNSFLFKQPVHIGDVVSFYAEVSRVGRTSITVTVEVYAQRNPDDVICVKVTEASLTYVAVGRDRRPRELPSE